VSLAFLGVAASLLAAAGCAPKDDYFPLKVGAHWTYTVKQDKFATRVQQVRVTRQVPVAMTTGYELDGPMGISRLAWRNGTLFADELPSTRLYKSLPMLVPKDPLAKLVWSGQVETLGVSVPAHAILSQSLEPVDIGAKRVDALRADLTLSLPNNKTVELNTWYAKGIGLVRQDQRTNGNLDIHVELLGGP
jgi:hypothetical protein